MLNTAPDFLPSPHTASSLQSFHNYSPSSALALSHTFLLLILQNPTPFEPKKGKKTMEKKNSHGQDSNRWIERSIKIKGKKSKKNLEGRFIVGARRVLQRSVSAITESPSSGHCKAMACSFGEG